MVVGRVVLLGELAHGLGTAVDGVGLPLAVLLRRTSVGLVETRKNLYDSTYSLIQRSALTNHYISLIIFEPKPSFTHTEASRSK